MEKNYPTLDAAAKIEKTEPQAPPPRQNRDNNGPSGGRYGGERESGRYGGDREGGRYGGDREGGRGGGYGERSYGGGDREGGRGGGYGGEGRRDYGDREGGRYGGDREGGRSYGGDREGGRGYDRPPREERPAREPVPIPDEPPFTAYVGNVPYEAQQQDIADFFEGLEVKDIRIVFDRETRRSKGFAYVEFEDQDALKKAVSMAGSDWSGRSVRVDVAERKQQQPDRRGGDRDNRRGGDGFFGSNRYQNTARDRDEAPRERQKLNLAPRTLPIEKPAGGAGEGDAAPKKKEDPFAGAAPKAVRDPFVRTEKPREERKPVADDKPRRADPRPDDSKSNQASSWRRPEGGSSLPPASSRGGRDFSTRGGSSGGARRGGREARDADGWQQQDHGRHHGGGARSEGNSGGRRPQGKAEEAPARDTNVGNAFDALGDANA